MTVRARSGRYRLRGSALGPPSYALCKGCGVEPRRKCAREPARTQQPHVAAGNEVAERDEPDKPPLHLRGVRLNREVDVQARVVPADRHASTRAVEPTFRA